MLSLLVISCVLCVFHSFFFFFLCTFLSFFSLFCMSFLLSFFLASYKCSFYLLYFLSFLSVCLYFLLAKNFFLSFSVQFSPCCPNHQSIVSWLFERSRKRPPHPRGCDPNLHTDKLSRSDSPEVSWSRSLRAKKF